MSARNYIKGLKRKGRAQGLGRGANSEGAAAELIPRVGAVLPAWSAAGPQA